MRALILMALVFTPALAQGEAPTAAELETAAAELPMPSVEARLRARAAAYRTVTNAARTMGFGDAAVRTAHAAKAPIVVAQRAPAAEPTTLAR